MRDGSPAWGCGGSKPHRDIRPVGCWIWESGGGDRGNGDEALYKA